MIQYAAFSKENGLMGWLKGPHFGGKVPATFLMADVCREVFACADNEDVADLFANIPSGRLYMYNASARI